MISCTEISLTWKLVSSMPEYCKKSKNWKKDLSDDDDDDDDDDDEGNWPFISLLFRRQKAFSFYSILHNSVTFS